VVFQACVHTYITAKGICYFGNCISHQNYNCWHGFMGWC